MRHSWALAGLLAAASLVPALAAPAPASAVRFAVKGDWGFGGAAQAAITRRMCGEYRRAPFSFVATTGDNFYSPDGVATASNYTRPERCLISLGVPWRAAWGNHDAAGTSTADVLGARQRWYAVTQGPLLLLVLDGNDPTDPAQLAFIRERLARATQPMRIVAFHQPIRTSGLHPPATEARRLWEPLFRAGHVTLALQGHNHFYERIQDGGITYITTGGGGAPLYPCVRPAVGLRRCVVEHNFLLVDARARRVTVRALTSRGRIIDRVILPARAA